MIIAINVQIVIVFVQSVEIVQTIVAVYSVGAVIIGILIIQYVVRMHALEVVDIVLITVIVVLHVAEAEFVRGFLNRQVQKQELVVVEPL